MTNLAALNARLRKVERNAIRTNPIHCIEIITESDEDEARQLAVLEIAGTYKPGLLLIAWRIVDPAPRSSP